MTQFGDNTRREKPLLRRHSQGRIWARVFGALALDGTSYNLGSGKMRDCYFLIEAAIFS